MPGTHPDTGAPVSDGECVCFRRLEYCWSEQRQCWRYTGMICNPPEVTNAPTPICGPAENP